jgi:hypothetical protein
VPGDVLAHVGLFDNASRRPKDLRQVQQYARMPRLFGDSFHVVDCSKDPLQRNSVRHRGSQEAAGVRLHKKTRGSRFTRSPLAGFKVAPRTLPLTDSDRK